MSIRTKEDICLLCKLNKSDQTGSHFTPAGLLKRLIGKRDFEKLYTIVSNKAEVKKFYGRSNLENQNPEIIKSPHFQDYIFCKGCEKKLATLESACIEDINSLIENTALGKIKIAKTKKENDYVVIKSLNNNIVLLFIYTILWRQSLQQYLFNGTIVITEEFQERLRQIINFEINKTLEEIASSKRFKSYPKIILLTSYHKDEEISNYFNPNSQVSNPYLFFLSIFDALVYFLPKSSSNFKALTGLDPKIDDIELILNEVDECRFALLTEIEWEKKNKTYVVHEGNKHVNYLVKSLMELKGFSYDEAWTKLFSLANSLDAKQPGDYTRCLSIAFYKLST